MARKKRKGAKRSKTKASPKQPLTVSEVNDRLDAQVPDLEFLVGKRH